MTNLKDEIKRHCDMIDVQNRLINSFAKEFNYTEIKHLDKSELIDKKKKSNLN